MKVITNIIKFIIITILTICMISIGIITDSPAEHTAEPTLNDVLTAAETVRLNENTNKHKTIM